MGVLCTLYTFRTAKVILHVCSFSSYTTQMLPVLRSQLGGRGTIKVCRHIPISSHFQQLVFMSTALDFMPKRLKTTLELKSFECRVAHFSLKEVLNQSDRVLKLYNSYDPSALKSDNSFKTLCLNLIGLKDVSLVRQLVDQVLGYEIVCPVCFEQLFLAVEAVNSSEMATALLEKLLSGKQYYGKDRSAKACCNIAMKLYKENNLAREGFRVYNALIANSSVNSCSIIEAVMDLYSSIPQSEIVPGAETLEEVLELRTHYLRCCRPNARHLSQSMHTSSWIICGKFNRVDKLQELVAAFEAEGFRAHTQTTLMAKLAGFNAAREFSLSLREYDADWALATTQTTEDSRSQNQQSLLTRPLHPDAVRLLLSAVREHYLSSEDSSLRAGVDVGAFSQHFMRVLTLYLEWDMAIKFHRKHIVCAALHADTLALIKDALSMYYPSVATGTSVSAMDTEDANLKALTGLVVEKVLVSMRKRLDFVFPLPPPHLIVDYLEVCDLYSRCYEDPAHLKLLNGGFSLVPKLVSRTRSVELSSFDKHMPIGQHQRSATTDIFGDDASCLKLASIYCRNGQYRFCMSLCMEYELQNYANMFSGAVDREVYLDTLWNLHCIAIVTLLNSQQTALATAYVTKRCGELHLDSSTYKSPALTEGQFRDMLLGYLFMLGHTEEREHHEVCIVQAMQPQKQTKQGL